MVRNVVELVAWIRH